MRKFLLALSFLALATPSIAADIPVKAERVPVPYTNIYNWTGFFIGGNAGYGKQVGTTQQSNSGVLAGLFPSNQGESASGSQFGVQGGYRYQVHTNWVVGIEGDFSWLNHKANTASAASIVGLTASTATSVSLDWTSTLRGVIGFVPTPMPNVLLYFTGGAAWGKSNVAISSNLTPAIVGVGSANDSSVKNGWVVGGGLEVMFAKNWTLRGEYLHIDFGDVNLAYKSSGPAAIAPTFSSSTRVSEDVLRAGINYRF